MKTFKEPDLNAPRFRGKWLTLMSKETLNLFKDKHPEHFSLSLKDLRTIVRTFNEHMVDGVITNRDGVSLPEGLGQMFIGTCPGSTKNPIIDFKKSIELGTQVVHKNWESDNKLMKIFYTNHNTKYSFRNKEVWAFKAAKPFRKKASDAYKENYAKYIEVVNTKNISAMFDRHRKKEYIKNLTPVVPEGYDEFKI